MTVQKIKSGRINTVTAEEYVAAVGTIFYNESLGDLRLGDGHTPGGVPIVTGGSGSASNVTLDGGLPSSVYGGLEIIDGGGV